MNLSFPEVLITKRFPDEIIRPLEEIALVHQWNDSGHGLMPRNELIKVIGRVSAIINQAELKVDREILENGKQLKIIANVSLGYDNMDLELMTQYGVWASNAPGFFNDPVAEYTIGGIIAVSRRMLEADGFVRNGEWKSFQPGRWDGEGLANKTLGVIGMGSIGKSLARLGTCLGMNVIYYSRSKASSSHLWVPLNELLTSADVISVHVPYSKSTHEMIGENQFKLMKRGTILVNTSRGKVINEPDLVDALKSGHLGGAVLDVFYDEPHVPVALKAMSNVILTPHISGGTTSGRLKCCQLAIDNVIAVLTNNVPLTPLNSLK